MNRREFGKTVAFGAAALMLPKWLLRAADTQTPAEGKPNIILVYSDDVGLPDIGCYGGVFKTPEIDKLAREGVKFEYCYSTPLCGPSRCETLTGRYPFRTGLVSNNSEQALRKRRNDEVMIPRPMKAAGYATCSVGKWGQMPFDPGTWGFDEYITFGGSGFYWREGNRRRQSYTVNGKSVDLPEGKYLPDILHDYLVDFISRNREKPFFVYYPMSEIHEPMLKTPDTKEGGRGNFLADNIEYMDKLVGKLVAELDRLKLREKTLVLFTGDNGAAGGAVKLGDKRVHGRKGSMWEGGSRVPLIANWPGTAPAGKTCSDLTDFSDFYPTFCELGGARLPEGVTLDGVSFAPQIKGRPGIPREWVYVELEGECYVADKKWKLSGANELFDMKDAPCEEVPVPTQGEMPEAAAARKRLQDVLDTKLAGYPKAKPLTPLGGRGGGAKGAKGAKAG